MYTNTMVMVAVVSQTSHTTVYCTYIILNHTPLIKNHIIHTDTITCWWYIIFTENLQRVESGGGIVLHTRQNIQNAYKHSLHILILVEAEGPCMVAFHVRYQCYWILFQILISFFVNRKFAIGRRNCILANMFSCNDITPCLKSSECDITVSRDDGARHLMQY